MTAMEIKEFNIEEVESLEAPMDWGAFAAGGAAAVVLAGAAYLDC